MRVRGWLGVMAALVLGACDREPAPGTPPPPRSASDTTDMGRAGAPERQSAPSGESGEGQGFPGEGSAVGKLPVREPINTGIPGGRSSEQPPDERR